MEIISLENERKANSEINSIIGSPFDFKTKIQNKYFGSNMYWLKSNIKQNDIELENSRCIFERFEKGYLLRINLSQKLFAIPIPYEEIVSLSLQQGEIQIFPISIASVLRLFKISKERIVKLPILSYGAYPMPAILKIVLSDSILQLETHGKNYYAEKKFFKDQIKIKV